MTSKMNVEQALAELEAGKFSFRMVEAITTHVGALEQELTTARDAHASAVNELRHREFAISQLEGELKTLKATVYALLKANALTQAALRASRDMAGKTRVYLPMAAKTAVLALEKAPAYVASLDLGRQFGKIAASPVVEKALREARPMAQKISAALPVAQKRAMTAAEKVGAYLATLQKKVA